MVMKKYFYFRSSQQHCSAASLPLLLSFEFASSMRMELSLVGARLSSAGGGLWLLASVLNIDSARSFGTGRSWTVRLLPPSKWLVLCCGCSTLAILFQLRPRLHCQHHPHLHGCRNPLRGAPPSCQYGPSLLQVRHGDPGCLPDDKNFVVAGH